MQQFHFPPFRTVLGVIGLLALLSCEPEETITPANPTTAAPDTVVVQAPSTDPPVVEDTPVTSSELNFQVAYDEVYEQTFYPSLVLGLANRVAQEDESFELINYSLTNPREKSEMLIKLNASALTEETTFRQTLEGKGKEFTFSPAINWDYQKLRALKQPGNANLSFSISIDGEEIDNQTLRLSYRSVNECVYGIVIDGEYRDWKYMFAAYVNEDNPNVDVFLKEALATNIVSSFNGYQGDTANVLNQVRAAWYVLQQQGVSYSSITNTSNAAQNVATQNVRFFDEVYNNQQANCVDGSVFLSSILKKVEILPFLVLEPGHMYLGFYASPDRSLPYLLETTAVGQVDLQDIYIQNNQAFGIEKYVNLGYLSRSFADAFYDGHYTVGQVREEVSYNSFLAALYYKTDQFNANIDRYNDPNDSEYQIVDIDALRQVIQPI